MWCVLAACRLISDSVIFNKVVLERQVLPAFAITYFCNHCNVSQTCMVKYVDTETIFKNLKGRWPQDDLWPLCVTLYPRIIASKSLENMSICGYSDPFFQKLEPKVIDPLMTFDPKSVGATCVTLPKDHFIQVPWEYINVCGYSDQFCKTLPKITTYYVQNEWSHSLFLNKVQARQK